MKHRAFEISLNLIALAALIAFTFAALGALPANAATHTMEALGDLTFSPAALTIQQGDTVVCSNVSGIHNVVASGAATFRCANGCDGEGGNGAPAGAAWSFSRVFANPGTVNIACQLHAAAGMTATITVAGGGGGGNAGQQRLASATGSRNENGGAWVPALDREQRTVGYGGQKEEELNRSPLWARLRAGIALPAGFAAEVGYIPPIEIDGVEASLVALALSRRIFENGPFALGLRLHLQRGKAKGDFTCKEGKDPLFPPGSEQNPFGCEAPSKDEVSLDSTGLELAASYDLEGRKPTLHAALSYNRLDVAFQVDARTFGIHDRTLLENQGNTLTLAAGATWPVGRRATLGFEALYVPLEIERPGQERNDDSLLHARGLLRLPLR